MGDKRGAGKVFQRNMGWAWGGGSPHIIGFVVDGNDGRVVFPIRRQHENTVRPGAVCGGVAGQVGATNNGGAVVVRQGTSTVNFQALPNDWVLWRGHRLAIRLVSSNRENFFAMKAQEPIEVLSSSVTMDIDDARHQDTYGGKPLYWQEYMNEAGCYPSADYVCKWEGPKDSAPTP